MQLVQCRMAAATFLAKRYSVVEAHLRDVGPLAVDDEVTEAFAEVGLVVKTPAVSEHLMLEQQRTGNRLRELLPASSSRNLSLTILLFTVGAKYIQIDPKRAKICRFLFGVLNYRWQRRGLLAVDPDLLGHVLRQKEVDLRLGLVRSLDQVAGHAFRPRLRDCQMGALALLKLS